MVRTVDILHLFYRIVFRFHEHCVFLFLHSPLLMEENLKIVGVEVSSALGSLLLHLVCTYSLVPHETLVGLHYILAVLAFPRSEMERNFACEVVAFCFYIKVYIFFASTFKTQLPDFCQAQYVAEQSFLRAHTKKTTQFLRLPPMQWVELVLALPM